VTAPSPTPLLEVRGVSKRYGSTVALQPLDFTISPGAIHGVLGKNGAGKSTLVGIVAGSVEPTSGSVVFGGRDVTGLSLAQRRRLGIRLLGQHAEVVPSLSVAENLLLPEYPRQRGLVDWGTLRARARELLAGYGLTMDVKAQAGALALPDQRKLSIVKTLVDNGKLAMLDEPTTSLSRSERRSLFDWMRDLNAAGQTFVYISHFNNEIREVCNEYTVVRDSRLVATGTGVRDIPPAELSRLVTGTNVEEFHRDSGAHDEPLLEVRGARAKGTGPLDLTVGRGEIVGLVGLPASGAQELARGLAGLEPLNGGTVTVNGKPARLRSVADAARYGIAYLTHDRIGEGLVPAFSVQESLHVGDWPTGAGGLVNYGSMRRTFDKYASRLSFRVSGPQQSVSELSGGNQQKILLGRLLALDPQVLILDEPTLGIDIGTKEEVHRLVDELTAQGLGVLVLAYDTDEMVRLVDRAVAFQDGRIVAELSGADLTIDRVLGAMANVAPVQAGSNR